MAKWNIGKHLSVLTKEKIIIGRKNLFAWVKDKKLAELLIRDYAIGNICLKNQLNKPSIILYSGVLEAVLSYVTKKNKDDFIILIDESYNKKFITESNRYKLQVLRDFRNYVHLSREAIGDFELTNGIAQLAQETCESVLKGLVHYKN
jgi:hypothetical protein